MIALATVAGSAGVRRKLSGPAFIVTVMSRASQSKRATRAKDRARQRAQQKHRTNHSGPAAAPRPSWNEPYQGSPFGVPGGPGRAPRRRSTREILAAARNASPVVPLLNEARAIAPATFFADAETVLIEWTLELYARGWQPTELIRAARLRRASAGAELVRLAVAAERATREGPTANDPRWVQQWTAAELPGGPVRPGWAAAWASTVEPDRELTELLRLALVLGGLPRLELLLPPPGGAGAGRPSTGPAAGAPDPILGRVRALLAKAESTEHESEALAFTAKAQELMTKHAIDLAMVQSERSHVAGPHVIRIPLDAPYLDAKALLLQTVAQQTRCRTLLESEVAMSSVIGYPTDLEAVELLFTSLLVQAQRGLAEASRAAPPGSRTRSQSFRAAFLHGFTGRIGERLSEVNRLAYADAQSGTFLPVLRSQSEAIDEFVTQRFGRTVEKAVRGGFDSAGYARGQLAADAAALTSGRITE